MRVEEMSNDEATTPNIVANDIFTKARQNVSDLLRGGSFSESRDGNNAGGRDQRSRAVQIRDHFNYGTSYWGPVIGHRIILGSSY